MLRNYLKIRPASHYLNTWKRQILSKSFLHGALLFLFLLFAFLVNGLHESYPDEFDNILGGWNILQGNTLYSNFFTHHGPSAYFLASLVELISGNSFVRFRIVYSVALLAFFGFSFWYFRRSLGSHISRFFPLFLIFFAVGATYFWGHMLLADNIAGILLSLAIGLIVFKSLRKLPISKGDLVFINIMVFISILSSLTYLYLVLILYPYVIFEYFSSNNLSFKRVINYLYPSIAVPLPYIIFAIYLVISGSFGDYVYQNFTFNQSYYIYNYPRAPGETFINPLRFAIIIAHSFLMNFSELLIQIKDFNFDFPFNITLAVGNLALFIYLFVKKKYKILIFVILMLIYANGRSNPQTSGERDYQSAVYIITTFIFCAYLIYSLYEELSSNLEYRKKLIFTSLLLLVFVYWFANFQFLSRKFIDRAFQKYMGNAPLIYDRPQIAPIMNTILTQEDYTWIGPFEFEELFYTKIPNASQYQIFNPGMGRSERIHNGLIEDFEQTKPKLVWFDKKFYILGENPEKYGQKFISYMNENYFTLLDYRRGDKKYVSVKPIDQRTDIETKLYIRNENADEIIGKLVESGIIKEVQADE